MRQEAEGADHLGLLRVTEDLRERHVAFQGLLAPLQQVELALVLFVGLDRLGQLLLQPVDAIGHLLQVGEHHLRPQLLHVLDRVHPAAVGGHVGTGKGPHDRHQAVTSPQGSPGAGGTRPAGWASPARNPACPAR